MYVQTMASPLGYLKICCDEEAVCELHYVENAEEDRGNAVTRETIRQLEEYFEGKRTSFDVKIHVEGTPFQKQVWQALCQIPYGETRSYKDIAVLVGNPKASRAIGMANNKNPIPILIPCHRVIGTSGKMVGYRDGIDKKIILLELEKAHQ